MERVKWILIGISVIWVLGGIVLLHISDTFARFIRKWMGIVTFLEGLFLVIGSILVFHYFEIPKNGGMAGFFALFMLIVGGILIFGAPFFADYASTLEE